MWSWFDHDYGHFFHFLSYLWSVLHTWGQVADVFLYVMPKSAYMNIHHMTQVSTYKSSQNTAEDVREKPRRMIKTG